MKFNWINFSIIFGILFIVTLVSPEFNNSFLHWMIALNIPLSFGILGGIE